MLPTGLYKAKGLLPKPAVSDTCLGRRSLSPDRHTQTHAHTPYWYVRRSLSMPMGLNSLLLSWLTDTAEANTQTAHTKAKTDTLASQKHTRTHPYFSVSNKLGDGYIVQSRNKLYDRCERTAGWHLHADTGFGIGLQYGCSLPRSDFFAQGGIEPSTFRQLSPVNSQCLLSDFIVAPDTVVML